jgi:hypothetical protein
MKKNKLLVEDAWFQSRIELPRHQITGQGQKQSATGCRYN